MVARAKSPPGSEAVEKAELLERFTSQMRATARRYSANDHDAEDAYQRAAEILLTHHPAGDQDELCRWLRTVVKHEALAIRRARDRLVPLGEPERLPEPRHAAPDTHERAERRERLSVGAQALGRLKPQEIRCLTLKAEGYSYREICERTGWTYTKVNRCLTEGRRAFLARIAGIEAGGECERLEPLMSALADGEAGSEELASLRSHLKTCLACRARLREYRAAPARVAALAFAAAPGGLRRIVESALVGTHDKVAALGERAHSLTELATAQKLAAVAASSAVLAGGGAGVDRLASDRAEHAPKRAALRAKQAPDPGAPSGAPAPAPKTPEPVAARPSLPPAPKRASPPPAPAAEFAPAPQPPPEPAAGPSPPAPAARGGPEFGP